jgi:hypothetical protein
MNVSHSSPTSSLAIEALLWLISVALILAALVTSFWRH